MILEIGNYLVSTEILTECFCCDYAKCQGCCCIIGDSGAPLEGSEKESLERQFEDYSPILAPDGASAIKAQGFFVVDGDGDTVTPLVKGDGRCAYSVTDKDGKPTDVKVTYTEGYAEQMLRYSRDYATLPLINN